MSARDKCIRLLSSLRAGDVIRVGRGRWQVEKNTGVTNYVIKHGTKGRKLYTLETTSIEPCCIAVREVWPGSGAIMDGKKPAATGCAKESATTWAGATRGRRRR